MRVAGREQELRNDDRTSVPEDGRLLPRLELVYPLAVPRQRTGYRTHTHRFKTTSARRRAAGFRAIEWRRGARLNASTLRLTPSRAAQESRCLGQSGFLRLMIVELLHHAQRIQVDPLFVGAPLDQPVGSALAVSWSGDAEQLASVGAVCSVAAHDCVSLCKV
jgi:hypothetical protein